MDLFKKQTGIDFNDFYTQDKAFVLNYIKRLYTKSNLDLEGVVDLAFTKVYQNIDKYDKTKSSIRTYVCKAAVFEIMYQRKLKMNKHIYVETGGDIYTLDYFNTSYDEQTQEYDNSIDERFESLISDVKEFEYSDVALLWLSGYTYEEMSKTLDYTRNVVAYRMIAFRNWMRDKYDIDESIRYVNKGKILFYEEPLRCIECGKILKWDKAERCDECNRTHRRLYDRPDLQTLEIDVLVLGYAATARKYGVKYGKSIKNWINDYKNGKK